MQALSDAKAGENYTIKWMFGLPEVLEFLHSHHVEEGCDVQVCLLYTSDAADEL